MNRAATVILPTYNEAKNLAQVVNALLALDVGLQVLVVDDNSPDGTGAIADALSVAHPGIVEVLHRPAKTGLGDAYLGGIRHALARGAGCVLVMDADSSHPVEVVPRMLALMASHDVAVGSRYVRGGGVDARWSPLRRVLSRGATRYAQLVTGLKVHDATAGFKCFRREALERLPLDDVRSRGYSFHIEIALLCQRARLRVAEYPILFRERGAGASKMSPGIVLEALWRLWQLRFASRRWSPVELPREAATPVAAAPGAAASGMARSSVSVTTPSLT